MATANATFGELLAGHPQVLHEIQTALDAEGRHSTVQTVGADLAVAFTDTIRCVDGAIATPAMTDTLIVERSLARLAAVGIAILELYLEARQGKRPTMRAATLPGTLDALEADAGTALAWTAPPAAFLPTSSPELATWRYALAAHVHDVAGDVRHLVRGGDLDLDPGMSHEQNAARLLAHVTALIIMLPTVMARRAAS